MTNIQHAYGTGDRSEKNRRLASTPLRSLPPLELLEDPLQPKAIEYKPSVAATNEDQSGARISIGGEKGWQFATQIDPGEENDQTNFDYADGN